MRPQRCSICGQTFDADESRAMPFCSQRCHDIDRGRWLREEYGLPYDAEEGADPPHLEDDAS